MNTKFKNIITTFLQILFVFFSFLILRIILIYIPIKYDVGFLLLKQKYIELTLWRYAFFIHVFCSFFALLAGFTQFSKNLLNRLPKLHRAFGYMYVFDVLLITGPAGLFMSFYANGGIFARIAFVVLSILWMSFTAIALYKAIKKDFTSHQKFMIRSFALTLSAISLRAFKVIITTFTDITPNARYRIIAWLGWTVNLIVAEIFIYYFLNKQPRNFNTN